MFSSGLHKKRKWPIVVIVCVAGLLQIILSIIGVVCLMKWANNPYIDDNRYDKKLADEIMEKHAITLSDVVEIDFDKAYLCDYSDVYLTPEQLLATHSLESNVTLQKSGGTDTVNCILLVKDNFVVYDITYSTTNFVFKPDGQWIFPDTPLVLTNQSTDIFCGKKLYISVG